MNCKSQGEKVKSEEFEWLRLEPKLYQINVCQQN